MIGILLGLGVVLLPMRFRQRWFPHGQGNLRASAAISGAMQMIFALALLIFRYPRFASHQVTQLYSFGVALAAAEKGGETAVRGMGIVFLLAYILLPVSLLLIYFAFEGAVRLIAATATGEVVGTLPFVLIEAAGRRWNAYQSEKKQGPRVPDEITVAAPDGDHELAIASCRRKMGWDRLMTVSYQNQLYEIARYLYVEGENPRRHIYYLRPAPAHKIVRGIHHYDPQEINARNQVGIVPETRPA